jgi:glycosyltransferase involved in cell wall biosynthesis
LRFYISGATHDGRKNHRIAIKVFSQVKKLKKNGLRDFKLVFIGVGEDSYSSETNRMGCENLGEKFVSVPKCNRDEALTHMNNCHIAICISEFEALPRYVSEGLFLGHPVLRNYCSGLEEQMNPWDQANGWLVNQDNEKEFIQMILEILDPNVTSDQELNEMRKNSRIKANLLNDDFENSLRKIDEFFQGTYL